MANAAAKKAAAGKASAQSFYRPFLVGVNVVYVLVRSFITGWKDAGVSLALVLVLLWGLQYYAYVGIVDAAAAAAARSSRSSSSSALVGGSHLDVLGLSLGIQFGAILLSPRVYYLVWGLPVWGAYTVYRTLVPSPVAAPTAQ